jgi:PAS domain S-box-containing protein
MSTRASPDSRKSKEQLISELRELRGQMTALKANTGNGDRDDALKWFEAIFNNTPMVPIQGMDRDGVITHWNQASEDLYGFTAKEALGRKLQDILMSSDAAQEFEDSLHRIWSTGLPCRKQEWEITAKGGGKRWVISTLFPIVEHGNVAEVICMDMDITDRLKAEEELRHAHSELELRVKERTEDLEKTNFCLTNEILERKEIESALIKSENFLKNTLDCIMDGITIMDRDMTIVCTNNTMEEWYSGRFPLVGKKCYSVYHKRSLPCENCPGVRAIKERSMCSSLMHFVPPDGEDRWREINAFPFKDTHGNVVGVISMVRDITRRMLTEEALEFERSQLLSIFDSIDEVIYVSDPSTYEILYANRAMKERFKKGLIGGTCYKEIQGRDSPCEFCNNPIILKDKGKPHTWEFYNTLVRRQYMITDRIIKWPDGRDVRFEIAMDITERKKIEEALIQAKSEAELYVDLMGHDINNMNQVGIGFLELAHELLAQEGKLGEEDLLLISKPLESFNNSSLLIDNVRKIQREKRGGYEVKKIDLDIMLREVIPHYSSIADKDVTINYDTVPGCHVMATELIKDVFLNLIGNAIKHSSGLVVIDITLESIDVDGRRYHRVSVEDNGPGISDDLKMTLFDRLNLTTTRARGKGFGLCLIKMLVDGYEGRFWVEDRVPGDYGQGARFVVMLPAANSP